MVLNKSYYVPHGEGLLDEAIAQGRSIVDGKVLPSAPLSEPEGKRFRVLWFTNCVILLVILCVVFVLRRRRRWRSRQGSASFTSLIHENAAVRVSGDDSQEGSRCPVFHICPVRRLDRLLYGSEQDGTGAHGRGRLFLAYAPFRRVLRQSAVDAHGERCARGPLRSRLRLEFLFCPAARPVGVGDWQGFYRRQ